MNVASHLGGLGDLSGQAAGEPAFPAEMKLAFGCLQEDKKGSRVACSRGVGKEAVTD